jgi:hypothetical protein
MSSQSTDPSSKIKDSPEQIEEKLRASPERSEGKLSTTFSLRSSEAEKKIYNKGHKKIKLKFSLDENDACRNCPSLTEETPCETVIDEDSTEAKRNTKSCYSKNENKNRKNNILHRYTVERTSFENEHKFQSVDENNPSQDALLTGDSLNIRYDDGTAIAPQKSHETVSETKCDFFKRPCNQNASEKTNYSQCYNENKYHTNYHENKKDTNEVNIDMLLERETQHNKTENWNKLDKNAKIQKLTIFSEKYGKDNHLSMKEIKKLKTFLVESLDKSKLQKTKDVLYNKETKEIISIPSLYLNTNTHNFSFKITDTKRVSTIKSLTPKRIQVVCEESSEPKI